ncbi:uncharacterized protein LOC107614479 [Arachis ipaensis]|uniref:uncharacterized protein LOC107614479 n=1 Tax=Arachis ipaensis TaxID=130454 RepID=UPI0007AEFB51|nr:uncharacterized protein LOC107614479 [Arachis ipaensis]XP_025673829.1 uncharacterized protein LOC112773004 [Arachis hypogaea]
MAEQDHLPFPKLSSTKPLVPSLSPPPPPTTTTTTSPTLSSAMRYPSLKFHPPLQVPLLSISSLSTLPKRLLIGTLSRRSSWRRSPRRQHLHPSQSSRAVGFAEIASSGAPCFNCIKR